MSLETYDVIIIGGSWAGLAAAMQLGRARRQILVVDAGQPRNRFAHASHGFLGQDGRTPHEIAETFRSQVLAYPTVHWHQGTATGARKEHDDTFAVDLSSGDTARARRLILATGVVDELPDVPGVAERWGITVMHCPYCHGYEVANQRLGVLATSDMAMHQALLLPDWSATVILFTNNAFTPTADQRTALDARGVVIESRPVASLVGDMPALSGIQLQDGDVIALDALFTASQTRMASPIAAHLGCAFEDGPFGQIVRTDPTKETTVRGVFCAGDAARMPHSATFAAADGAMAGIAAHRSLIFTSSAH